MSSRGTLWEELPLSYDERELAPPGSLERTLKAIEILPMSGLSAWRTIRQLRCHRPGRLIIERGFTQNHLPQISECPPSTCHCADMPSGLDIKTEGPMTMPPYSQHVIVYTGRADWPSKIEKQDTQDLSGNPAKTLKQLLGLGGKYHDPQRPTLVTYSNQEPKYTDKGSVFVWPHNRVVHGIDNEEACWEDFVLEHIFDQAKDGVDGHTASSNDAIAEFDSPVIPRILVCGHGKRDERCGVMGPLLLNEFRKHTAGGSLYETASISHIGGHVWAGNVIIYFPHEYRYPGHDVSDSNGLHPLRQTGIWYGRVQPKHVQGIVEQTLEKGIVIDELLRGVHRPANNSE